MTTSARIGQGYSRMTCSGWHLTISLWFLRGTSLHLKMPFSFLPCGCCSQPDSACCPGPVSGHYLPTFSSTLDPVSSPLLENSNVTFRRACIFAFLLFYILFPYLFFPLIAAPESIIFSFRFVESILLYSTMTVSFFSTYSIHLKIL